MPENLKDLLAGDRLLLCDGAMGTQLQVRGLAPGACGETWNLTHPERVLEIHTAYRDAGSDLLTTNSFGASELMLATRGEGGRASELNRRAAELAREVAGPDRWVLGDLGPFGGMLAPLGEAEPREVLETFRQQAAALIEGGADAILIETMTAIEEMALAVQGAREVGAELVIASFAFDHNRDGTPRTMMGVDPRRACEAMVTAGVDVVGCNCGSRLGQEGMLAVVRCFRETCDLPVLVQPNAGQPELTERGIVYHESPGDMAQRLMRLLDAGARIAGGCCGTTPEHIAAARAALDAR